MHFIVYSNVFVSLCATGLTVLSYILLGGQPDPSVAAFVFFSTLAVYNTDRLVGVSEFDTSERHEWISDHKSLLWGVNGVAVLGVGATMLQLPGRMLVLVFPLALMSALYTFPVVPGGGKLRRLKDLPGAKTFVVALIWSLVTVGLPVVHLERVDGLLFLERALFVFAITLPFEIRDMERDQASGIQTLPHRLGIRATKGIGVFLLMTFVIISAAHYLSVAPLQAAALIASGLLTIPLIIATNLGRKDFFFSVIMDGTMLFQVGLVGLAFL